ncbi:MAG: hypothetical protein IKD30_03815 [Peptococcaceae bacterium]|nr:hypothetical protein [Peptococcaceae bacterium]
MSNILNEKNKKFLIHVLIMFILGGVISQLPPFGKITELGMEVLAVFVMLIYGWIFIDLFWVSLFGFFLLGLTNVTTVSAAFGSAMATDTMYLLLLVGALAGGLDQLKVGDAIANFMLSRKIIVGRPWLLVIFFIALAFLLGLCNKGILGMLLLWNIVGNIAKSCGYEDKSAFLSFICCMIAYYCFWPAGFAPYLPNMLLFGGIFQRTGFQLDFAAIFVWGMVLSIVMAAVMLLLAKFVFRIDASKFNISEETRQEFASKKVSTVTKAALVVLAGYILILVAPQFMNPELFIVKFINKFGILGWTIAFFSIFFIWRNEEGKPALDPAQAFAKIPWTMLMVYGVTVPMGSALSHAEVGIMATVAAYVTPLLGKFSVMGIYIFTIIAMGVITQFLHNMVVAFLFMPLLTPVAVSMGADPNIMFLMLFIGLACSFATPAASMNSGFIFGNPQIDVKRAYLYGWTLLIVAIVCTLLLLPLFQMLI